VNLSFGILGPLEVWGDGALIGLGGARQRALLAILLLHANRVVPIERLVDLLWGDEPPETAINSLQVHVSQLRRVLEPERAPGSPAGLLVHRPSGYMLAVEPDQLDVHRFEQLAREGGRALTDGEPERAASLLHDALVLWRGPALDDFADELFAVAARARLEELRLTTLEDRIQADMALRQHASLIAELQALVREHPLRERLGGQLMLCLYRAGRQAEATEVFQRTRRRLVEELGLEPGPELQALLTRILEQDPALEVESTSAPLVPARVRGLPLQVTSFIGRQHDLLAVKELLVECRLLTLLGPAGIGKTRLALRVASQMQDAFSDGVCLVDLTPVSTPEQVPQRALAALYTEQRGVASPVEAIVRRLSTQQVLLVVDNCEHVVEAAADLFLAILQQCPAVAILATSRERLNLSGERVWRVDPLSVPPEGAEAALNSLLEFESVQLYVDRAKAADRSFALTQSNAPAVSQLCRRLDGLPLALELAAANTPVSTPLDMLALLDERVWLPARPARGTHPRQQTLEAALDWSYQLLAEDERTLLRRLSSFAGHFSLQAAEQVCTDDRLTRGRVLALLSALADKSLVATHESVDGTARYRLLNTVQQYAAAKLVAAGEADDAARRHARYMLGLAAVSADAVHGSDFDAWMHEIEQMHADLTAALTWSQEADRELWLRLAAAAAPFWEDRGYLTEGRHWLTAALGAVDADHPSRPAACLAEARLAFLQNDFGASRTRLEHGLAAASHTEEGIVHAGLLRILGLVAAIMGDSIGATSFLQQSLEVAERLANNEAIAHTLHSFAQTARVLGDDDAAQAYHVRALVVSRLLQSHRLAALSLFHLSTLALRRGELAQAEEQLRDSLGWLARLGARVPAAAAVASMGLLAGEHRQYERGVRLVSAAVAFAEASGIKLEQTAVYWFGGDIAERMAAVRQALAPEVAAAAWDLGHRMSLDEAIGQALAREVVSVV
jgi:predicted ATPase/DNA-binding SARP family transcriptional activator